MSMLLRRYYDTDNADMGTGATVKVAPNPTPQNEVVVDEKPEEKKPTRAEIMKMNVATVRAYAETQGIENVADMSGAELKRILVDKMFDESE